jgi:hypothetical protein
LNSKTTRYEYPDDEEAEKWRKQLPDWFRTGKINKLEDV